MIFKRSFLVIFKLPLSACPMCGCIDKANRNKKIHLFTCKNCGYKSNDDRIAAMNLHYMGINYLIDKKVPVIVE